MTVRKRQKDHVMALESVGIGGVQRPIGQRQQVGVMFTQQSARAGGRSECADRQPSVGICGVAQEQSQDLSTCVSAGTGHCH